MGNMKSPVSSLISRILSFAKISSQGRRESFYRKTFKKIGNDVVINDACFHDCERISIGDYVYIGPETTLFGRGSIQVSDHVIIGPGVMIMSSLHNWDSAEWLPYDNVELLKPVSIGEACWIGARSIIMPGVQLGLGCVVAAGAVVTKSWGSGAVVGGNPAKLIKRRDPVQIEQCVREGLFYLKKKHELGMPLNQKDERTVQP
jgi:acetyltransferase-like isoleucine patch superfamily enzyme